jgi:hypothetical protein
MLLLDTTSGYIRSGSCRGINFVIAASSNFATNTVYISNGVHNEAQPWTGETPSHLGRQEKDTIPKNTTHARPLLHHLLSVPTIILDVFLALTHERFDPGTICRHCHRVWGRGSRCNTWISAYPATREG